MSQNPNATYPQAKFRIDHVIDYHE